MKILSEEEIVAALNSNPKRKKKDAGRVLQVGGDFADNLRLVANAQARLTTDEIKGELNGVLDNERKIREAGGDISTMVAIDRLKTKLAKLLE